MNIIDNSTGLELVILDNGKAGSRHRDFLFEIKQIFSDNNLSKGTIFHIPLTLSTVLNRVEQIIQKHNAQKHKRGFIVTYDFAVTFTDKVEVFINKLGDHQLIASVSKKMDNVNTEV